MKKSIIFLLLALPLALCAQPKAKRPQSKAQQAAAQKQAAQQPQQAQQQASQSNGNRLTTRAQISFPTSQKMEDDVVWRRDVYREINLEEDANAGLYYPVTPQGAQMNLFTYIFKLMLSGQLKCYEYKLDNNEVFTDSARVKPLRFLNDYHIYYERKDNGAIRLDNSDIPSAEVKRYYIKEASYYDQRTSTFHTRVLALCPILSREEDSWGDGAAPVQNYPLFWVKYDDLAPFLSKQTIMTSNLNNAATMSMDDFFSKNLYKGKIYRTVNMQGKTLIETCNGDSAAIAREQQRIEEQIKAFEKSVWGDPARKDSLDSIQRAKALNPKAARQAEKAAKQNRRAAASQKSSDSKQKATEPKQKAAKQKATKPSGSSGTLTVRRQRH